jgi:hypothetical protein
MISPVNWGGDGLISERDIPMAEAEQEAWQAWYDRKSTLMEEMLGKEHDMVMHSMIPYAIGGNLDLYYYPNGVTGTGVATK